MKHTPGPWTPDWDDSGQWYVSIGGLSVSGNALRGDSGESVESANAHLIAAAPELLEACKAIANWCDKNDWGCVRQSIQQSLYDAIQKAEGVDPENGAVTSSQTTAEAKT